MGLDVKLYDAYRSLHSVVSACKLNAPKCFNWLAICTTNSPSIPILANLLRGR